MRARWSTVRYKVTRLNPRSQTSNSNIWVSWGLNSYSTKICCAGQTKLCLQDNFVAEDNSNYMKDNYDVKLLQWLNKIIKDSFTPLSGGHRSAGRQCLLFQVFSWTFYFFVFFYLWNFSQVAILKLEHCGLFYLVAYKCLNNNYL